MHTCLNRCVVQHTVQALLMHVSPAAARRLRFAAAAAALLLPHAQGSTQATRRASKNKHVPVSIISDDGSIQRKLYFHILSLTATARTRMMCTHVAYRCFPFCPRDRWLLDQNPIVGGRSDNGTDRQIGRHTNTQTSCSRTAHLVGCVYRQISDSSTASALCMYECVNINIIIRKNNKNVYGSYYTIRRKR